MPGGLENIIARVPGRDRRDVVVVGAHYDTKDIPEFLGANDGAVRASTEWEGRTPCRFAIQFGVRAIA